MIFIFTVPVVQYYHIVLYGTVLYRSCFNDSDSNYSRITHTDRAVRRVIQYRTVTVTVEGVNFSYFIFKLLRYRITVPEKSTDSHYR